MPTDNQHPHRQRTPDRPSINSKDPATIVLIYFARTMYVLLRRDGILVAQMRYMEVQIEFCLLV